MSKCWRRYRGGVDVMLDTLGAKAPAHLSVDAMQAVGRGGRIVQIGGVAGPIPIDPHPFMCAQLHYIGSLWFTTAEAEEMACMVESGILDLSLLESRAIRWSASTMRWTISRPRAMASAIFTSLTNNPSGGGTVVYVTPSQWRTP